eukprot:maker-scaffold_19-snap-gene-0.25-mRNA-1 protein AED:0.01 eAED:0.01 QI:143/1/1/1/1/1/2/268/535
MVEEKFKTPGRRCYAIACCIFASMGGLYFGYDQGVTGGMLTMRSFRDDWCEPDVSEGLNCSEDDDELPTQFNNFITLYNVLYNIGCIFGGLLGGLVAGKYGRKAAVFFAALTFNVGTYWVITTPAGRYGVILSGRILEGIGVGSSSFASPLYAAEVSPREFRGAMAGFSQMMIVTGLLASSAVNILVEDLNNGWRITNGVITVPPVIVMLFIYFLPESPRYIFQKKGGVEAQELLVKIRKAEPDEVVEEVDAIKEQVDAEDGLAPATYKDCFAKDVRKRTFIAIGLQILQQATGINPVFTYGGLIFSSVNDNEYASLFVLAAVNFTSTIPSLYWVDSFGRRTLLLFGAVGMCIGHLLVAISYTLYCDEFENEDGDDEVECDGISGQLMVAFTSFFIFCFAISWGPIGWIYPSEIFPLHVRARCVSLSTAANWSMGALMIAVVQLFPIIGISGVFFLFAGLCVLCWLFVYYNCPETRGVLLEDIEYVFSGKEPPHREHKEEGADVKEVEVKGDDEEKSAPNPVAAVEADVEVKNDA